jgi:N-acetylglucosamine kinase
VGYIKTGKDMKRFGGWGWSIGDMSSATWFSKKAIEIAMMEMDSEQDEKPFLKHLERHFKMPLRDIAWQVETRKMPKEDLASFSTNLSPMASSGNSEAISLYDLSADYMGKIVRGIKRRYPDAGRVSIMGGTMQAGEFYYRKIRKHIPDVNIYFGYEIIAGAIMHHKNDVSFKFRDKLLEQLDSALRAIPEADLKKYLNIERPLHLP